MPAKKRIKTKYLGVYFIKGKSVSGKPERIYYIRYRKKGRMVEEKAGRQFQDDMTPARASQVRTRRIDGSELSNRGRREADEAKKVAELGRWTIDRLFNEYFKGRPDNKSRSIDKGRYINYIKPHFGHKEPKVILPLDVDRLRISLLKKRSPQTVKHILNLLTWIINFGVKRNLCDGIPFHIQKPPVYNIKTEDLSDEQLKSLLHAIEMDSNIQIKNMMRLALFTGLRRGEMFKLKWEDIKFERGFIHIRDPKGGPDERVPLNDAARELLKSHSKTESPFVFPGRDGKQRVSAQAGVNKIKKRAGLPKDFRPLHGLRHAYASMLASSGRVDLYTLQKLLTHKDPRMTQRYAHLRDEALKRASDLAGSIIEKAANARNINRAVNLEEHKK
jgi:integrase